MHPAVQRNFARLRAAYTILEHAIEHPYGSGTALADLQGRQ